MCVGPMGASRLERIRGGAGQGAGMEECMHGALSSCVVGGREERCCRQRCVVGLLWRGLGHPYEFGDGSRGCSPRGFLVVAKVNPGSGTEGWGSRGARRVVRPPSQYRCRARHRKGYGGPQRARQWVPVVEVVPAEQRGRGRGP